MAKIAILYCKRIKDHSCIACSKCFKGIAEKNAEFCFNLAADSILDMFKNLKNEFFRERAADIYDVKRRIMRHLTAGANSSSNADASRKNFHLYPPDRGTAAGHRRHTEFASW